MSKLEKKSVYKKINILITRPEKDSKNFLRLLDKEKFKFFISPLLKIKKNKYNFDEKSRYDFVLFTSKNGVLNFNHDFRGRKVIVIGDGTYSLLQNMGITNVINVNGNLESLKEKIKPLLKKKMNILHPTSSNFNQDLKNFFFSQGCFYHPICCYKSIMVNSNLEIFKNFFNLYSSGLVALFSRRTAISFKKEILKLGFNEKIKNKKILVLSEAIAEELRGFSFKEILISKEFNEKGMINLIKEISEKEESVV